MCVYVYFACICICRRMCIHLSIQISLSLSLFLSLSLYISLSIHIYIYIYILINITCHICYAVAAGASPLLKVINLIWLELLIAISVCPPCCATPLPFPSLHLALATVPPLLEVLSSSQPASRGCETETRTTKASCSGDSLLVAGCMDTSKTVMPILVH